MPENLLAIDNGTQSVRALLFDPRGNLLAKQRVPIESYYSTCAGSCRTGPRSFLERHLRSLPGTMGTGRGQILHRCRLAHHAAQYRSSTWIKTASRCVPPSSGWTSVAPKGSNLLAGCGARRSRSQAHLKRWRISRLRRNAIGSARTSPKSGTKRTNIFSSPAISRTASSVNLWIPSPVRSDMSLSITNRRRGRSPGTGNGRPSRWTNASCLTLCLPPRHWARSPLKPPQPPASRRDCLSSPPPPTKRQRSWAQAVSNRTSDV